MRALRLVPLILLAGCSDDAPAPAPAAPPPVPVSGLGAPPARLEVPGNPPAPPPPVEPDPIASEPDPIRRRTLVEESWFRTNFRLEGHALRFHDLRPFLVAEFVPDPPAAGPPGEAPAFARTLPGVVASMREFFREVAAVDLPPLEDLGDERLRWIVFPDRKSFVRWHRSTGRLVVDAPYAETGRDGLVLVHPEGFSERDAAWLTVAQAMPRWKRHFCRIDDDAAADAEGKPREPVTPDDRRLRTAYSWLDRGLQSWFAEGRPAAEDYEFARRARELASLWPLEDFVFADSSVVRTRTRMREGGARSDWLDSLHASQSRVLFDTLLEGERGRWREGLAALLRREIRGVTGKAYLLEAFGLPKRSDTPEVQRWIADVEKACLARIDAPPPEGK